MIKTMLSILVFLVVMVALGILIFANAKSQKSKGVVDLTKKGALKKKLNTTGGAILLVAIVFGVLVPNSFHQVEAGQVAVVKSLGKVVGTRTPGTYFDFYLTHTISA